MKPKRPTQKKLLEEQNRKMQLAVEQSPVSIVITDRAGIIEYVNPKFTKLTGYSFAEAVGQNSRILKTDTTPDDLYRQLWEQISIGGEWRGEILNRKKSGESFWEWVRISPIKNPAGETTHYLAVKEDISARKAMEAELMGARDAAEAGNRLKSEFLANMSHEIRTPMNGIIGMADLLRDTVLTGEQTEYVQAVKSSAESLLTVINDILDFSKIETRKLELENLNFELRSSLENILYTLACRASEKGLSLVCTVSPEVPDALVGDPGRLIQVLVNLVANAVKFTERGQVQLRVGVEELCESGASLSFAVTDTGIGIAAELQRKIFHPFCQVDASATRRYGGTGLGLAISARLVEMMGGNLQVQSEPGRGSSFHFTVRVGLQRLPAGNQPREKAHHQRSSHPEPPSPATEIFDGKEALARMDGDWDLFREVSGIFATDSRLMTAEIGDAIAAGDGLWLNRAAHTLKGAISNFNARVPFELALRLEMQGKSGELSGAGEQLAALEAELEPLRNALERYAWGEGR